MSSPDRGPFWFADYRRVFAARAISSGGTYMQIVAGSWYAYHLTRSATAVGVLAALALGPAVVGGPLGGALADRYDPRRTALLLSLLQAVPPAVLATIAGLGDLSLGALYALVFAGAVPFSLNQPVMALVVSYTVPEQYRHSAVARTSLIYNITRLSGAVVGGAIVHWLGLEWAFALNAASYLFVAAVLAGITLASDVAPPVTSGRTGFRDGLADGWALRLVRLAAVAMVVFFGLIAPVEQLMPTIAEEHGMTASVVGLLVGAVGVGALLANPLIGTHNNTAERRRWLMAVGLVLAAAGMTELALTPHHGIAIDLMGAALIGVGWEFLFVGGQSLVAIEVPANIRGRMMGFFYLMVSATTALGAIVLGLVIDTLGLVSTFLTCVGVVLLTAATLLVIGHRNPADVAGPAVR